MDEIDRKIIEILEKNSRASYKDIAKHAKISDVAVHKRIKKLEESVIKSFSVLVKQSAYEREMTAVVSIRSDVGRRNEIAEALNKIQDVTEIYTTVGDYDIIAKVRTKDIASLKSIVEKEFTAIKGINEIRTSIVFQCFKENVSLLM